MSSSSSSSCLIGPPPTPVYSTFEAAGHQITPNIPSYIPKRIDSSTITLRKQRLQVQKALSLRIVIPSTTIVIAADKDTTTKRKTQPQSKNQLSLNSSAPRLANPSLNSSLAARRQVKKSNTLKFKGLSSNLSHQQSVSLDVLLNDMTLWR